LQAIVLCDTGFMAMSDNELVPLRSRLGLSRASGKHFYNTMDSPVGQRWAALWSSVFSWQE